MTKPTAEYRKHIDFNNKWSMDIITRIEIKNEQIFIFQNTFNLLVNVQIYRVITILKNIFKQISFSQINKIKPRILKLFFVFIQIILSSKSWNK